MTDFFKSFKDSLPGFDAPKGKTSTDANESAVQLSQQVNQIDAKKTTSEAPQPDGQFDAKKLATDLAQQMHELSVLHDKSITDPLIGPQAQQEVADKIRAELSPLWQDRDHMTELLRAMRDQGAEITLKPAWPDDSKGNSKPLFIELDPQTRELTHIVDWRDERTEVDVFRSAFKDKNGSGIIVSGGDNAQGF